MPLAYERAGSGPPLVLMHGVGHRRQAWYPVLDRLTPYRDVILVDLPGHGESSPLDLAGRPAVEALLDEVVNLVDALGLQRPHFGGNSLGGRLALEAGVTGHAASVTALSPAGFWRNEWEARRAGAIFKILEEAGRVFLPLAPALSRSRVGRTLQYSAFVARPASMSPAQARGDMIAFVAARDALNQVLAGMSPFTGHVRPDVPITVAWGTRDRLLPERQILKAKAWLPGADLVPLPDCGHVPMTDDPALVAEVLLRGSRGSTHPA